MDDNSTETPDIAGTVRGYRTFDYRNHTLEATHNSYIWLDGVNYAHCGFCPRIPGLTHSCGLYSSTDPRSIAIMRRVKGMTLVFGVVENSGGIVQHEENGVQRAAQARIVALLARGDTAEVLAQHYPSARIFRSEWRMLRAFPPGGPPLWRRRLRRNRPWLIMAGLGAVFQFAWTAGTALLHKGADWAGLATSVLFTVMFITYLLRDMPPWTDMTALLARIRAVQPSLLQRRKKKGNQDE